MGKLALPGCASIREFPSVNGVCEINGVHSVNLVPRTFKNIWIVTRRDSNSCGDLSGCTCSHSLVQPIFERKPEELDMNFV